MTHEWKSSLAALTATELREQLQSGIITSRKLVDACLSQIQAQNKDGTALRAMISVLDAGKAMAEADKLDQERSNGSTRAYFHGIPIVVKVSDEEILPPACHAMLMFCRIPSTRVPIWAWPPPWGLQPY